MAAPHASHQASARLAGAAAPSQVCCRRSHVRLGQLLGGKIACERVPVVPAVRDADLLADRAPIAPLSAPLCPSYRLLERRLSILQCVELATRLAVYRCFPCTLRQQVLLLQPLFRIELQSPS